MDPMSTTCCTTQRLNLIIIGRPGSGKGTQARMVALHYGIAHVTSGDLLRQEVEKNGRHAKKIQELLETGKLFPDDMVNEVLLDRVPKENFILDGYPRRLSQTKTFDNIDLVIYIDVPEDEVTNRILHRNEGRQDDTVEAIEIRLRAFKNETEPVIKYYKEKGLLTVINGLGSQDDVFARVKTVIFEKFNID